jgi:hypothetical protein
LLVTSRGRHECPAAGDVTDDVQNSAAAVVIGKQHVAAHQQGWTATDMSGAGGSEQHDRRSKQWRA